MLLDFTSLLLATAFSGVCLSLTMLGFWLSARSENFMITWAAGLVVIAAHVFAYWAYVRDPVPWLGFFVVSLLPVGIAIIYAAARQFVDGSPPVGRSLRLALPYLAVVLPLLVAGLDGVALIVQNAAAFSLLVMSGAAYWFNRREAPVSMGVLASLYVIVAITFALCGAVLLVNGQWSIGHAPDNWAERFNIVVSVACMTGMGALSLALNQTRLARRHRADAMTDPLTGLMNRRALFTFHDEAPFGPHKAIVMFDLDHFKQTNDIYGHAVGDEVIRRFAAAAAKHSRPRDDAVRLGGEEFALVMSRVTPERAHKTAERIAAAFGADTVMTPAGELRSTVSAGIGFGDEGGATLEEVLTRADKALYQAKRLGRNTVSMAEWRLAG